jgi:hypothetical protein
VVETQKFSLGIAYLLRKQSQQSRLPFSKEKEDYCIKTHRENAWFPQVSPCRGMCNHFVNGAANHSLAATTTIFDA